MKYYLFLFIIFLTGEAAFAQTNPQFGLPIDCTLGENCWVMNYMDTDPAENSVKDFKCNQRSYDNHKGTDFAVRDKSVMAQGVDVLAAKDGTVERIRDGEPDRFPSLEDIEQVKEERKECGNAVLLNHGSGLQTLYCHLKKDSVTVKSGDTVTQGQKIGQVGLSGLTQFPHVHFGVLWESAVIDPYTGFSNVDGCGRFKRSLWDPSLNMGYEEAAIYHGGFQISAPNMHRIDQGLDQIESVSLSENPEAFVYWTSIFGPREGDQISIVIKDPNGRIFSTRNYEQPKNRARQFLYTGRKLTSISLMPGTYIASVELKRGAEQVFTRTDQIEVTE